MQPRPACAVDWRRLRNFALPTAVTTSAPVAAVRASKRLSPWIDVVRRRLWRRVKNSRDSITVQTSTAFHDRHPDLRCRYRPNRVPV